MTYLTKEELRRLFRAAYDNNRTHHLCLVVALWQAISHFHRPMLRPYSVSAEAIERGHASLAECLPMAEPKPQGRVSMAVTWCE